MLRSSLLTKHFRPSFLRQFSAAAAPTQPPTEEDKKKRAALPTYPHGDRNASANPLVVHGPGVAAAAVDADVTTRKQDFSYVTALSQ